MTGTLQRAPAAADAAAAADDDDDHDEGDEQAADGYGSNGLRL
jgi:hypothetical protein